MAFIIPQIGERISYDSFYHTKISEGVVREYKDDTDEIIIIPSLLQSTLTIRLENIKNIINTSHNIKLGRYLFTKFTPNLADILEITGHLIKWKYVKETLVRFNTSDIFINNLKLAEELPNLNKDSSWTSTIKPLTLMFDDFDEVP